MYAMKPITVNPRTRKTAIMNMNHRCSEFSPGRWGLLRGAADLVVVRPGARTPRGMDVDDMAGSARRSGEIKQIEGAVSRVPLRPGAPVGMQPECTPLLRQARAWSGCEKGT